MIRIMNKVSENTRHDLNVGMVVVVSVSGFGDGRLLLLLFFSLCVIPIYDRSVSTYEC